MIHARAAAGVAAIPAALAGAGAHALGRTAAANSSLGVSAVVLFIYLAILVVALVATVRIITKAGYSGLWVLITFVPVVNFVMILVFAFSDWPVLRELRMLRSQSLGGAGYGFPRPEAGRGTGYGQGPGPSYPGTGPAGTAAAGGLPWAQGVEAEPPLPPFRAAPQDPGGESGGTPRAADRPEAAAMPPPGWYPTPDGRQRYWDGGAWTDHWA